MFSFVNRNTFVFLVFTFGSAALLMAQQYKSVEDFLDKYNANLSIKKIFKLKKLSSITTTSINPTTITTTASINPTTATTENISSYMINLIELLCGSFSSALLVITFKFIRNGFKCKLSWFVPKFKNYHQDDKDEINHDNNISDNKLIDLVVLDSQADINVL